MSFKVCYNFQKGNSSSKICSHVFRYWKMSYYYYYYYYYYFGGGVGAQLVSSHKEIVVSLSLSLFFFGKIHYNLFATKLIYCCTMYVYLKHMFTVFNIQPT